MPKRLLKQHLENVAKTRRKSMLIDDPSQLSTNLEEEPGDRLRNNTTENTVKQMRYIKTNHNNEIERLLLYNSKSLAYHVDHSNFPAFNVGLWPQESNEALLNYPSCAFSVPHPLYVSKNECEQVDLCFKRSMAAEFYKKRLRHARTAYQTAWKANKTIRNASKKGLFHSSVFDLAERVYMQPDPFFDSSYDYYFTGGNLCTIANDVHVVHAGGEQLRNIMVSNFSYVEDCIDTSSLVNSISQQTAENNEIFEISPLKTSLDSSRQNCFITRQRNLISFSYLNSNDQVKTVTQFRTKNTPFISFAQSERDINTFIITTMKQHVRLYDLNRSVPALVKLFEISPKTPSISWNTTKPWRENTFLYANEKQFFLIDVRTSPEQWMQEVTSSVDSVECDHISALLPSDFNNLFYVATNHKLQCMDIRHLKKFSFSDNEGAICRWSHQLRYAPLMMDSYRLRQTEYVALSSALSGDLHICQLNRERNGEELSTESPLRVNKHVYYSPCLPYQPPTLIEAYENARLSGKCILPEANLETRIKCCTTGMSFLKSSLNNAQSGIGLLLTSNSNGDVFGHTLSKREKKETDMRCNEESNEKMNEFERRICQQSKPTLNYTHIKNMRSLRKVFLCKNLSAVKKYDFDAMDNEFNENETPANDIHNPPTSSAIRKPKRLRLGRWQKSLSSLYSYKDALVPDLLSIWDIDIEDEKCVRLGNLHLNIKTDPEVKVKDWLASNINSNPPMLTIPAHAMARYNESDVSNIFDNSLNITETQNSTIDFENVIHSTQLVMDNAANASNTLDVSRLEIQIQNEQSTTVVEKLKNKKKNKKTDRSSAKSEASTLAASVG